MLGEGSRNHVLAPNAKLSIAAGKSVYGGLFGRDVEMQPDGRLYHRPFTPGTGACDGWSIACIPMPGCVLPDADSDSLADCEESEDDSGWTDPEASNGAETTLIDTCPAASSCESLADHDAIEACAAGPNSVTAITQGGWNFRDVGGTVPHPQGFSPCDPEYGFTPGWDELLGTVSQICDERLWLAWFKATIEITQSGTHCFELVGVPGGGCGSFFFGDEDTGLLSNAGPRCYDIPAGLHPVDWTHESGTGTGRGIEVLHCYGGDQECTPDVPLGPETIRPPIDPGTVDPCDPEHPSCSDLCPCAGCEPCNADADCSAGQLCDGEAARACGTIGKACWYPPCRRDPIAAGCGSDTSLCGPICPEPTCADEAGSCPSGLVPSALHASTEGCTTPCVDPVCLTHDGNAENCGGWGKLCGPCTCIPDCSFATCAAPDNRCGGECPSVCANGESGCTTDIACDEGMACINGTCRPRSCTDPGLRAPLCGSADAPCGPTCPTCTPECSGRE